MKEKKLKICLYLELYHFMGGAVFKNIGTGLLSSYKNQKKILDRLGVEYTEKWDDSADILQINTPWLWSLHLIKKARRQNKKVIIWSHVTAEDIRGVFRFSAIVSPIMKKYLAYAYNLADVIFSPTEYTKSLLVAYGIPADKIIPMSNAVDTNKYVWNEEKRQETRKQYGLTQTTIGTVALAVPRKGVKSFLSLAKTHSQNNFIWFGKIYSSLMTESLPKDMPKNTQFTGYVPDIIGAFSAIDVFVFLSYEENEGMAILEAASIGLPIIVRDIPVYRGWLVHGENCLKATTDLGFRDCLNKILNDSELREKLKANARLLAQKSSLEEVGRRTMQVYDSLFS